MISVVIATLNDEAVLGRTLAPLVPAAVSGFVREVIVADGGSSDATLEIADDAGCAILAAPGEPGARVRAAAATARSDWLMIVPAGVQLLPGWEAALRPILERRQDEAVLMPAIDPKAGWLARLVGRKGEGVQVMRTSLASTVQPGARRRLHGCAIRLSV